MRPSGRVLPNPPPPNAHWERACVRVCVCEPVSLCVYAPMCVCVCVCKDGLHHRPAQWDSGRLGVSLEGGLKRTSRWSQGCSLWAGRSSYTPAPTGIRKLNCMSRHEACGVATSWVCIFWCSGFQPPRTLKRGSPLNRLGLPLPRAARSVVNTTSEFETWRWPLSRLSSSQRPTAMAHQPGKHSMRHRLAPCGKTRDSILRCHGVAAVSR